ncbi:probable carboxylesterase 12 [Rhododendron vialii]|uniref:probable carboxylesterase 12 n=1 Tax=Rhododendron vialii TaxID=182163 RepID=UPI00265DEDBD|nr:probable carboxylesterase 12 [Rhododendron vialii]
MGSCASQITHDFPPFFRVHKDGRIERLQVPSAYAPPAVDPQTGVESKDVVISPDTGVKARIFLPKIDSPDQTKLPLLVHYHGGAFCVGSSLDIATTRFLNILTSVANAITVSVDYRLAPEHPLPTAYDDSWSALQWIATHLNGKGPELWLNEYVDFGRIFLMGDSAGANIAHHMAVRVGATGLEGFKVSGAVIVHPYFAVNEPDKMIQFLYPGSSGTDSDPKLNPKSDPDLDKMGCEKVLVFVAEKDWLKSRGVEYCETLKNSGWKGNVELVENEGEDHVFYKLNPTCEKALLLMQKLASFVNQG